MSWWGVFQAVLAVKALAVVVGSICQVLIILEESNHETETTTETETSPILR